MRSVLGALVLALACAGVGGCGDDAAGASDAARPDAPADAAGSADADERRRLSGEDLYLDFAARTLNPALLEYQPQYALWSDGAVKRRWIDLPDGTTIDASDPDGWVFPVGTRFWKEFRTPAGALLETRLIERIGPGDDPWVDYFMGAFLWEPDESEAFFVAAGERDVNGTAHDVPSETRCRTCHQGSTGFVLGFSAIQLSRIGAGTSLDTIRDRLDPRPADGVSYPLPGDAAAQAALGTLHANCGHCHNPRGSAWGDVPSQILRVAVSESGGDVTATQLYGSTVLWTDPVSGQPFQRWVPPLDSPVTHRIVPGDHAASAIWFRMTQRGNGDAMPPIFTDAPDDAGVLAVETWIDGL
jgi:hypothetical protein